MGKKQWVLNFDPELVTFVLLQPNLRLFMFFTYVMQHPTCNILRAIIMWGKGDQEHKFLTCHALRNFIRQRRSVVRLGPRSISAALILGLAAQRRLGKGSNVQATRKLPEPVYLAQTKYYPRSK
jgi:hypothetical protein